MLENGRREVQVDLEDNRRKKISIMVPCYNEEENVIPMSEALVNVMTKELPQYDYEILFIDNCSQDRTENILRRFVKAIRTSKLSLMLRILDSSIRRFMVCARRQETVRYRSAVIFRIRLR